MGRLRAHRTDYAVARGSAAGVNAAGPIADSLDRDLNEAMLLHGLPAAILPTVLQVYGDASQTH